MSDQSIHRGECFCGAVQVEVRGEPMAMGYCHCSDCRAWSAGPVNAFSLWPRDAVTVTAGADHLATYCKTDASHRQYCTKCGGHVMSDHPGGGFTDVYAALLTDLDFAPAVHVFYAETVLHIKDGLPKFANMPQTFGGSGEELPE